jgi:hypothetical protein
LTPLINGVRVKPSSNSTISVAVHSTSVADGDSVDLDATQANPSTLKLGVGEAANIAVPLVNDWDGAIIDDIAFGFRTQETGMLCGDTDVTLEGETYAGYPFTATDFMNITDGVDGGGCHP